MPNNYLHFTPEQFASDSYFQDWVVSDDHMTNIFWEKWLKDNPDKKATIYLAKEIIHQIQFKDYKASEEDFKEVWKNLKTEQTKKFATTNLSRKKWYAIAAVASIVLLISIIIPSNKNNNEEIFNPIIVNNTIKTGTNKAILTLEDGSEVALKKGQKHVTKNSTSTGEQLIYKTQKNKYKNTAYNYLTTPKGGQYVMKLSDGTKIWLNSESKLKYPVRFTENKIRQVELVYGEAYFDVSPSEKHKGMRFKVYHNTQEIEVLGTEFNVKAYKDETTILTTLVEGKVTVGNDQIVKNLLPNEQSILNPVTNTITISPVDVYREISWKEGVFSFKSKPLKDIMKVLARWYEIEVIFENKELENITFNGALKKDLDIIDILSIININYKINNKTVVFLN